MDLGTVQLKVYSGAYASLDDMSKDVRLIQSNCIEYVVLTLACKPWVVCGVLDTFLRSMISICAIVVSVLTRYSPRPTRAAN